MILRHEGSVLVVVRHRTKRYLTVPTHLLLGRRGESDEQIGQLFRLARLHYRYQTLSQWLRGDMGGVEKLGRAGTSSTASSNKQVLNVW
ncbi:MAG: hypothetical protein JWQ31_1515 [Mycobacterium sp.]|nr:hypothetical protein [Mycobacterium sp.]